MLRLLQLLAFVLVATACRSTASENLLAGRAPAESASVLRADRISDGLGVVPGDLDSNSNLTARFVTAGAHVTYDLGQPQPIRSIWIQAEDNDTYQVLVSDDGRSFRPIWQVPQATGGGFQARFTSALDARGRYLRLTNQSGDGLSAVTELQVASTALPAPPTVPEYKGFALQDVVRHKTLVFGCALIVLLLLAQRRSKPWALALLLLPVLVSAWQWIAAMRESWPLHSTEVSLLRGTLATVAAVAVLREFAFTRRWPASGRIVQMTLLGCGLLAIACFYNLGRPQFFDAKHQTPTYVHLADLRQYLAVAKYFPELGYTHSFEADVLAYAEDEASLEGASQVSFRDLSTHEMVTGAERRAQIEAAKRRFSAERWQEFKRDARFLREIMSTRGYLDAMVDHGGNATPVWIAITYALFNLLPTSSETFFMTGLFDPLLLAGLFLAIARTFGLRAACVCMVIFGANDFIMFGTNWAGATLRHDWLCYLGFAACALKTGRFTLAGVLLGFAAAIRAFPGAALIGLSVAPASWFVQRWWAERRRPSYAALAREHAGSLRALAAAAATLLTLVVATSLLFSAGAWSEWLHKVSVLSAGVHVNHISLRSLITGPASAQHGYVLYARWPILVTAALFYTVAVVLACRVRRPEQAAMTGLTLIPVLLYPANYYIHFIFLLPLAFDERAARAGNSVGAASSARELWIPASLLAVCAAQYFTTWLELSLHFYLAGVLLFVALTVILATIIRTDYAGWWQDTPAAVFESAEKLR